MKVPREKQEEVSSILSKIFVIKSFLSSVRPVIVELVNSFQLLKYRMRQALLQNWHRIRAVITIYFLRTNQLCMYTTRANLLDNGKTNQFHPCSRRSHLHLRPHHQHRCPPLLALNKRLALFKFVTNHYSPFCESGQHLDCCSCCSHSTL